MIYDAIGNPLEYRDGWKCEWSRGHRLDKIENSGYNVNVTFKYDENGIRTQKIVNGVQTDFITSGIKLLGQKAGENVLLWQVDGNGNTIGFNYNNIPYFYMKNLQGDIVGITDASGNIVAKYTAAIANPFVQMSVSFGKQANLLWYEIFDIVKQNCTTEFTDTPHDDVMELLLTARRKK